MKNYILPALISLALISPYGLTEESSPAHEHEHPAATPAVTQPIAPPDAGQIRAMQKQSMQELMRKIQEVQDPVERQRLTVAHIQDMQQHLQEMQMMLGQNNPPMPGSGYPVPGPNYGYPPIYGMGPPNPNMAYLANGGYAPPSSTAPAEDEKGKKKECDMENMKKKMKKMKEKMEDMDDMDDMDDTTSGHEEHHETSSDSGPSLTKIEQSLARIVELLEKNSAEQSKQ
ncbi:MAG: hypothetical protein BWK79_10700 [Beggiatoa sp. IS2]|nr:MAG: hypothetical protein BWK79_10700 [Beggiatoa sp. IS2]